MIVHQTEPYNAEPPPDALADRAVTALDTFYSRNHGPIPQLDPHTWRLRVDGEVDHALSLSLAELQSRFEPRVLTATLQCAGNRRAGLMEVRDIPGEAPWGSGAISTAEWTGVRLADVLAAAGLGAAAEHVAFAAPDISTLAEPSQPYGASIPVTKALAGEVLLAWGMNGEPLPAAHGAPVRVVVPGYIGARSVKWVQRVSAQRHPSNNYFQATAYRLHAADSDPATAGPYDGLSLGVVAVNADILRPVEGQTLPVGATEVTGYAFAGDRGVARVDVSLDSGRSWVQADLDEPSGPWAWRLWRTTLEVPAGPTVITARAWDTAAACQPESARLLWNPKGYVNNSWARVRVVGSD
ncbi:sulfite oxidase [Rhodococcus spelaei]|uniref:Sulfite oxidase n=2 Tax=Rhodococcus spelaei TaxID=2546320 RepID=A0A541B199_9NOCA|nr:sulfite oxidase [Rhodococcus spelaei]